MTDRLFYYPGKWAMRLYSKLMLQRSTVFHRPLSKGAKILVANHPTTTDPFYLIAIARGRMNVLINDFLFKIPLFGKYLKLSGYIPVTKGKGKRAIENALDCLRRGITIIVFIEGDMSPKDGGFLPPRTGAVRLALASGLPLIPIGIGLQKKRIRFSKVRIGRWADEARWYFRGPYAVTVGVPVKLTGNIDNRELVRNLSGKVIQKISRLAGESRKRIK